MFVENERIAALERNVAVVGLSGWLTLGSIALVVVAAVVWSFMGTLPTKVAGSCILMNAAGIAEVAASAQGRLAEVNVRLGDRVRVGQVIASIAQPDLDERVRRARARMDELASRASNVVSLSQRGLALNDDVLAQRRDFLRQQREVAQSRVRIAEEQHATVRQLLEQGLVTRRAVEDGGRELRAAELAVRDINRQIDDLDRGRTEVLKRETDERSAVELELLEAQRELAMLEGERGRATEVVSPFEGRVIEIKAGRGMLVSRDAPLVSLERAATGPDTLEVVMYVAAVDGKKIQLGGETHVVPATVRREEAGHLFGHVRYVSDYPATPQSLIATLGNEELVRELANVAAPFEIRIDLRMKGGGHEWSREGVERPPLRAGTLCTGEVLVRKELPVGFVIPALRREVQ